MVSPCKQKPNLERMAYTHGKITPIRVTEQFEDFLRDLKESFWGDLYGRTRLGLEEVLGDAIGTGAGLTLLIRSC